MIVSFPLFSTCFRFTNNARQRLFWPILGVFAFFWPAQLPAQVRPAQVVSSPDGHLSVEVLLTPQGQATYTVRFGQDVVMPASALGLIRDDGDFSAGLRLVSVSPSEPVSDTYQMRHGKRQQITYRANRRAVHLANRAGQKLDIQFQVANDGVAFRYHFPEHSADLKTIRTEATSFQFRADTKGWLQPCAVSKSGWNATNPSYEEHYWQNTPLAELPPSAAGWAYPALFQSGPYWLLLSETAPNRNYCGTRLKQVGHSSTLKTELADPRETVSGGVALPTSQLPWTTPWRLITVGTSLATIVESTLGTDLARPAIPGDFSFVKPGRAAWSWGYYQDDSTTFDAQKSFIDYAARMGWEYNLVDAKWDRRIGHEKMDELAAYAATKRVGLLLWYNSSGDWNTVPLTPKSRLLTPADRNQEFARLREMGIRGIKVDFFGGDGQSMMAYYQDLTEAAAKYGLVVNYHGATLPRGWQRTYPNLLTAEAVRGYETVPAQEADRRLQPTHCSMLPFTRNVFDPMDYTPTLFSELSDANRATTNAFELALPFLFLSGIQHIVEVSAGMAKVPDYVQQLMKDLPVVWDDTRFVAGFPGKLVVIARRAGRTWYVAGINGEAISKSVELKLPFISAKTGVLVTDGATNRTFEKTTLTTDNTGTTRLVIRPNGGFVLTFQE